MKVIQIRLLLLLQVISSCFAQPLRHAHAHNDYEHKRPLFDALSFGFTSVEADIYLINDELYVSHNRPEPESSLTLDNLYLHPLDSIMQQNGNRVYKNDTGIFYLMIDIKTAASNTYLALAKQLKRYSGFYDNPYFKVFISDNRDKNLVIKDSLLTVLDGVPADTGKNYSINQMPIISDRYSNICKWNGKGDILSAEYEKLKRLANAVHREGKKLRLWDIPDNENAWLVLLQAGIDFINSDNLEGLAAYFKRSER